MKQQTQSGKTPVHAGIELPLKQSVFLKLINYIVLFCLLNSSFLSAQVSIGINMPEPSAMLEVNSIEKGLLPPRMTQDQRNAINGGNAADGTYWLDADGYSNTLQPVLTYCDMTTDATLWASPGGKITDFL